MLAQYSSLQYSSFSYHLKHRKYALHEGSHLRPMGSRTNCNRNNLAVCKHNKPVVQIAPINVHVDTSLNCDEVSASRTAVNHLVSLGHTKIGIVNDLVGHAAGEWRYQGYCEATHSRTGF